MKQYLGLSVLITATGLMEMAALSCLALFVTSLTTLDQVLSSRYVAMARNILGPEPFRDAKTFYLFLGLAAITLIVIKNLMTALQTYITTRLDGAMNVDYGERMLGGVMLLPYERIAGRNSAEISQILGWRMCINTLTNGMMTTLSDGIVSVLLLGSLLVIEPTMTLVVIIVLGVIGFVSTVLVKRKILALGMKSRDYMVEVSKTVMNGVQGVREVKLFEAQSMVTGEFRAYQSADARVKAVSRVVERTSVWLFETIGMGGLVAGSIIMIFSTDVSSARVMGTLSMLAVSAWRILPGMYRTVSTLGTINSYVPYLTSVKELVEEIVEYETEHPPVGQRTLSRFKNQIVLRNIEFRYSGAAANTLNGLNLALDRGACVGIIGGSGAGKSTLADLLVGLVQPTGGEFLVDEQNVDDTNRFSWRQQVGLVSQQPYLFDGTIAQNVAFCLDSEAIDQDRVDACCRLAGVSEFMRDLPQGANSPVGERGAMLSGGQAQRIAIARALYRKPELLVFDEATSSLDDKNERTIRDTILSLRNNSTIVIIAHRLRVVKDCDVVIWLQDGRIHEIGVPDEVLPKYALMQKGELE